MLEQITYRQEVYRKLIHLSSLWMPVAIHALDRADSLVLFGVLGSLVLCLEQLRRQHPAAAKILDKFFSGMLRAEEKSHAYRPTGAFFVLAGAFLCVLFFEKTIAVTALAMMLTGDVAAALIGRRFGRIRILDKSLEGTAAFIVVAFFSAWIVSCFVPIQPRFLTAAVAASVAASVAELFAKKVRVDDNLLIPLVAGCVLTIWM